MSCGLCVISSSVASEATKRNINEHEAESNLIVINLYISGESSLPEYYIKCRAIVLLLISLLNIIECGY